MEHKKRKAKVGSLAPKSVYSGLNMPWISIRGFWLEKAGFHERDQCEIEVHTGKLIITKV